MDNKDSRRLQINATPLILLLYMLVFALLCLTFFASNTGPFDIWKQYFSNVVASPDTRNVIDVVEEHKSQKILSERLVTGEDQSQLESTGFVCHSSSHTDVCVANKPVRINTHTMEVYAPSDETIPQANIVVRPYPRKDDENAMSVVSPVQILHNNFTQPTCNYTHSVPAIVFSSGGFFGNVFHEFNEIIIPLFITSRYFQSRVWFMVVDYNTAFMSKYQQIISHLSDYELIISPPINGSSPSVHCFPGAIVGLHYHENLAINSTEIPLGHSMSDFKQFLRQVYNLKISNVSEIEKPVLILISRVRSRTFLNENEIVGMIKELGFRVVITRPDKMSNIQRFSQVVNSCSVMVGIHGAGLTNELFLPNGAVMVQVVTLGLEYPSNAYYGGPAKAMGVHNLKYKIRPEESSLYKLFGRDHPIVSDPQSIFSKDYHIGRAIYMDRQDVKIDLVRFRETLVEALRLVGPQVL